MKTASFRGFRGTKARASRRRSPPMQPPYIVHPGERGGIGKDWQERLSSQSIWEDVRKVGNSLEPLKKHRVHIPRNSMDRKQPVLVPRFLAYFGDVKVAKIEN